MSTTAPATVATTRRRSSGGGPRPSPPPPPPTPPPGERERVGKQEQHVVPRHRGLRARSDQARRRVAEQGVGERQGVVERPELVRLEELERLVGERVSAPRDLPRLNQRIAEVLGDVLPEVQ